MRHGAYWPKPCPPHAPKGKKNRHFSKIFEKSPKAPQMRYHQKARVMPVPMICDTAPDDGYFAPNMSPKVKKYRPERFDNLSVFAFLWGTRAKVLSFSGSGDTTPNLSPTKGDVGAYLSHRQFLFFLGCCKSSRLLALACRGMELGLDVGG